MVELEGANADECIAKLLEEDPTHNDDVDEASEQEDFEEVHTGIQTACMLRDLALLTSDLPPVYKNRVLPGNAGLPGLPGVHVRTGRGGGPTKLDSRGLGSRQEHMIVYGAPAASSHEYMFAVI